ncbi:GTPase HflX, partial [bacterium]|nr:GTPase HflX [bacterium]
GLILDIFALRAKSREAKTQVELAQLEYLLPRLTRQWTHFSESFGGIGTKGPGETQLETDRRLVRTRISKLKEELRKIEKQRETRRKSRSDAFRIALIGYTNVGKSTLFNSLSDANTFVEDRLFATLDATVRKIQVGNKLDILVSDTVGFIKKLPHSLVASFKSTLEEAIEADLLLHVVDISNPIFREQIGAVNLVLDEIKIRQKPTLLVFNKVDKLESFGLVEQVREEFAGSVFISAQKGIKINEVREKIYDFISENFVQTELKIPLEKYFLVSKIYSLAEILEQTDTEEFVRLTLRCSKANFSQIQKLCNW